MGEYREVTDTEVLEKVRKFFAKDHFATENGAVIEKIGEGYARCSLQIGERHLNGMGAVMGGVPFTLADFAFAVAANRKECKTVSLHSDIAFLGTAKGEKLIAEAHCIKDGRATCYYQIQVHDELENPVAVVNITGFRKNS